MFRRGLFSGVGPAADGGDDPLQDLALYIAVFDDLQVLVFA